MHLFAQAACKNVINWRWKQALKWREINTCRGIYYKLLLLQRLVSLIIGNKPKLTVKGRWRFEWPVCLCLIFVALKKLANSTSKILVLDCTIKIQLQIITWWFYRFRNKCWLNWIVLPTKTGMRRNCYFSAGAISGPSARSRGIYHKINIWREIDHLCKDNSQKEKRRNMKFISHKSWSKW